jgi:hypothetical protein
MDISEGKKIQTVINNSASRDASTSTRSNSYEGTISMSIYNTEKCYVYWLHLPEHTDISSQGYIGVSIDPKQRLWEHKNDARKETHHNKYLERIINKHELIQSIIFTGNIKECYTYEEELRPTKNIGWNLNRGGDRPPSNKGKKFSSEHCANITKGKIGKKRAPVTNETKQKISQAHTGRKHSEEHKEKVRQARLGTTRSVETKKKLSESHKGNIPGNANSITTFLGTFSSIAKAAKAHNLSRFKFESSSLIKSDTKSIPY